MSMSDGRRVVFDVEDVVGVLLCCGVGVQHVNIGVRGLDNGLQILDNLMRVGHKRDGDVRCGEAALDSFLESVLNIDMGAHGDAAGNFASCSKLSNLL